VISFHLFDIGRAIGMDLTLLIKVVIMGIVEGLTEFLPISSTGHLILAGSLLNFTGEKVKVFEIVIQAGAMLAVCWEYRVKIARVILDFRTDIAARRFVVNLLIHFLNLFFVVQDIFSIVLCFGHF
jgi:undecaprenyl-diphosphatase